MTGVSLIFYCCNDNSFIILTETYSAFKYVIFTYLPTLLIADVLGVCGHAIFICLTQLLIGLGLTSCPCELLISLVHDKLRVFL